MHKREKGFTLIELMLVGGIICILIAVALPAYSDYLKRSQVVEGFLLTMTVKKAIGDYYAYHGRFPSNNQTAGVPPPERIIGDYVSRVDVVNGDINVEGKVLSLRPAIVTENPSSPISWLCGYAEAVPGMTAIGENRTTVPSLYLSPACRAWNGNS